MAARILLHLPAPAFFGTEQPRSFWVKLHKGLKDRGIDVQHALLNRADFLLQIAGNDDFHIVNHGNFRHPRVLNAGLAYVAPYWYLDPCGIRALSSIGARNFDASLTDAAAAADFLRRLARRQIGARASRYPQASDLTEIPDGCVAVFLQSDAHRSVEETCHLTREEMMDALLARGDPAAIVVKPHPRDDDPVTRSWLADLARQDRRLVITDANIHDILARARVTVTINSAVGIEGLIHRVPLVLCGRTDFHHIAETVRLTAELDDAVARAIAAPPRFAEYLHWFFALNCLASGSRTLIDDVLARIAATGFILAASGRA
jgi:hypothetical protein